MSDIFDHAGDAGCRSLGLHSTPFHREPPAIVDGWNPIETAPTDEWVLITDCRKRDYIVGQSIQFYETSSLDEPHYAAWVWATDYIDIEDPTHWMKLPDQPKL